MAQVITPPTKYHFNDEFGPGYSVFLGGTIDMGNSFDWQADIAKQFDGSAYEDIVFLNPRRATWDSGWEQSINHPEFRGQVEWELEGLDKSDLVIINLLPESASPISLLELGLVAHSRRVVVCCPEGFYREGNIDIFCKRYHITLTKSYKELTDVVRLHLDRHAMLTGKAAKLDGRNGRKFPPQSIADSFVSYKMLKPGENEA